MKIGPGTTPIAKPPTASSPSPNSAKQFSNATTSPTQTSCAVAASIKPSTRPSTAPEPSSKNSSSSPPAFPQQNHPSNPLTFKQIHFIQVTPHQICGYIEVLSVQHLLYQDDGPIWKMPLTNPGMEVVVLRLRGSRVDEGRVQELNGATTVGDLVCCSVLLIEE